MQSWRVMGGSTVIVKQIQSLQWASWALHFGRPSNYRVIHMSNRSMCGHSLGRAMFWARLAKFWPPQPKPEPSPSKIPKPGFHVSCATTIIASWRMYLQNAETFNVHASLNVTLARFFLKERQKICLNSLNKEYKVFLDRRKPRSVQPKLEEPNHPTINNPSA
jgi:hypothetical protein